MQSMTVFTVCKYYRFCQAVQSYFLNYCTEQVLNTAFPHLHSYNVLDFPILDLEYITHTKAYTLYLIDKNYNV